MAGSAFGQSMVLSFDHIFILAGGLFLFVLPLLFLLRTPKQDSPVDTKDMHVEM